MKLRYLVPVLFLIFALFVPVGALEAFSDPDGEPSVVPEATVVYIMPEDLPDPDYGLEVLSKSPVTPGSTSGLKSVMLSLLGNYDVIVGEYSYTNNNGTVNYIREMQPDYVWLVSAGVFALVLYCVFRMGGVVLCKK